MIFLDRNRAYPPFGIRGNGVDDDAPAISAALAAAGRDRVVLAPGTYRIDSKITMAAGQVLRGVSSGSTDAVELVAGQAIAGGLIEGAGQLTIEDISIDCAGLAESALSLYACTGLQAWIDNIKVVNSTGDAMVFDQCQGGHWGVLLAEGACGGHGLNFIDCNDLVVDGIRAAQFPGPRVADKYGVRIAGETTSGGVIIDRANIENNWYGGVLVESASARCVIRNLRTELGAVDHVVIRRYPAGLPAAGVAIENAMLIGANGTISGGTYDGLNNRCIRAEDAWFCDVRHLLVGGGAGTTWINPLLGSNCREWRIDGAMYASQVAPSRLVPEVTDGGHTIRTVTESEGTTAPTTGTWFRGSRVWNSSPASGQPMGWMCVATGIPGTWLSMGNLP